MIINNGLTRTLLTRSRAFMGMIPLDPTPTGMWSNRLWVNCSLTGWTSFSSRLVRRSRTPQLISNPTPPAQKSWRKFYKALKITITNDKNKFFWVGQRSFYQERWRLWDRSCQMLPCCRWRIHIPNECLEVQLNDPQSLARQQHWRFA